MIIFSLTPASQARRFTLQIAAWNLKVLFVSLRDLPSVVRKSCPLSKTGSTLLQRGGYGVRDGGEHDFGDVEDGRGGFAGELREAVADHGFAEGAADGDRFRAGGDQLLGAVDAGALLARLLHPHAPAARPATERAAFTPRDF